MSTPKQCSRYAARDPREMIAKINGADIELCNFVVGLVRASGSGPEASQLLLRAIDGVPANHSMQYSLWNSSTTAGTGASGYDAQELGRKFLESSAGSVYIDLDHLEVCIPEVLSAFDHLAAVHAMYSLVSDALVRVNASLRPPLEIKAIANNSDGQSHSYGAHINFLVSRRAWDDIFVFKPHCLQLLASHQVSSIVFTGQGKVGSENGRPRQHYQLSQRADFFEVLSAAQTTYERPVVNSRNEPLCGRASSQVGSTNGAGGLARLHCIFYDANLAHVASVLKVGTTQIVLAMIEAGVTPVDVLVESPIEAVLRWSHDPSLRARCRLVGGDEVTSVELQRRIFEHARRFVEANDLTTIVPRADEILSLWDDVLAKLEAGDLLALAGSIDWILKLHIIEETLARRPDLDWDSVEVASLDRAYGNLDREEGLFFAYDEAGAIVHLVDESRVQELRTNPPEDTRAWTRAMLLRALGDRTSRVDWDSITFDRRGYEYFREEVRLDDPRRFTKADCGSLLSSAEGFENALLETQRGRTETDSHDERASKAPDGSYH